MKPYILKYSIVGDSSREEKQFECQADSINNAVDALVKSFDRDFNPANIDIDFVAVDGQDLGNDGVYDAEIALAKHYS